MLPRLSYAGPRSLDEALDILAEHGSRARLLAGGTDLMPKMAKGALRPELVVSLRHVGELRPITYDPKTGLIIGAMARLAEVMENPHIRAHYPAIAEAAAQTANIQIRNMGTLAGNICNGSPCADSAPTLLAYGARVRLARAGSSRWVALEDFFLGPAQTVVTPEEVLVCVAVPPPQRQFGYAYRNIQARAHVDVSAASVGAGVSADGGRCAEVRIFLGAVGPTPLRAVKAEAHLQGSTLDPGILREAGEIAASECRPITDVRASASYRRRVIAVLTRRAVAAAAVRAGLQLPTEAQP